MYLKIYENQKEECTYHLYEYFVRYIFFFTIEAYGVADWPNRQSAVVVGHHI